MARVTITADEASRVADVLREIGTGLDVPSNLRADAALWARRMEVTMDRRDLRQVASLLRSASKSDGMPRQERRTARRWAAHIRARI
jgi:uncharacterized protein (UPF0147 family)